MSHSNDPNSAILHAEPESVASDYLTLLASHVPDDISDQLDADGQPDIRMPSTKIRAADPVHPFEQHRFPTNDLWDYATLID